MMKYLHSMIRVQNLDATIDFFCNKLNMIEVRRYDSEKGRFTNVFLAAPDDLEQANSDKSPLLEITYNWPNDQNQTEEYSNGRNFGHLAYEVDDIYQTCQDLLESNVSILRPPRDGYMAFIKSPDGVSIELLQKGKALPIAEPWLSMKNDGTW